MNESGQEVQILILIVGIIVLLSILIKSTLNRVSIPALIGYMILGFLIRLADSKWGFLSERGFEVFEFLASIGIIALLFRVGLESNLTGLIKQLRPSVLIWIGNVSLSGLMGFLTTYYLLHMGLSTSLIVATALTATSLGVSVGVWQEADAINSKNGQILIDVAEMDDISAIVLMALVFSILPILRDPAQPMDPFSIISTLGFFVFKLILFGSFCIIFSLSIERHITSYLSSIQRGTILMFAVLGIALVIAAVAGLIGFSIAIGAFFAGLVFSRDPESVNIDASFNSIYQLLVPFFFIGIGLNIDSGAFTSATVLGVILLAPAVIGKVIGAGVPAMMTGFSSAILLGVSMVPRAEIALIIMQEGLKLGDWAVPPHVFAAMVVVSAITCFTSPLVVNVLLRKWPQVKNVL